MDARRQRFSSAMVIVVFALSANALLDYRLILRNPAELEEIARNALQWIFPNYTPHMGRAPEFFLSERKAVIHDVVFHEEGQAGRTLFRVGTLEAYFTLVPPALVRLDLTDPVGVLRVDREGHVNFETGGKVSADRPTLFSDLHVKVERGQLRIINDFEGQGSDLLVEAIHAELDITRELAVKGGGGALFGLVVDAGSQGRELQAQNLDPGQRLKPLVQGIKFSVEREVAGRVLAEVNVIGGELSHGLRSVIPPLFQEDVWDELDPSGTFDATLRVDAGEKGARVATTVLPHPAAIRPRGFPMDITDITGRFEVNVFVPWALGRPDFIGVSWDGLTASCSGGQIRSRGAVFPGEPGEHVSLFINADVQDLAISPAFRNALPERIRAVYDEFDPQGVVQRARVVIFKGPFQEEPQLSVKIDELAGALSASYRDYPLRLQELQGTFEIREDANVEVHAGGTFQDGGSARVDAHVVRGDLMHIDVRSTGIPVGPSLLASLPPRVRSIVGAFRPDGGTADVHVVVDKAHAGALALPTIDVDLSDVLVAHEEAPYPLTASGRVRVVPRFPEGARPEDHPDASRIEVGLDLRAWGEGVVAATVSGALSIAPGGGPFEGAIHAAAEQVALDAALRQALPPALVDVWEQLSPAGVARDVAVTIEGPERLRFRGQGAGLTVRLAEFPYPLRLEAFDVSRDGRTIRLNEVRATSPRGNGALLARGTILQPGPQGRRPIVDLDLESIDMPLDDTLVAALPGGAARTLLEGMRPEGRANATLRVLVPPGDGPPQVIGSLDLRGVQAYLHEVDPSLAGLAEEPLRGITGSIFLDVPERVELTAVRGELAGAKVEATGAITRPPVCPPGPGGALGGLGGVLCAASAAAPAAIDLTVHVGDLVLNERTRAMAGPAASDVFARFQPEGPVDLQARVHRAPLAPGTRMRLRARPRGLTVVPSFLPLRVSEVEGEVEVEDGEPVRIDLSARAGGAVITIHRDQAGESAFPGGGARGRVFEVAVRDYARPTDPRERAELERELPDPGAVRSLLSALAPEGPIDVHAFVYQPLEERQPMRWVAELRAGPQNDPGSPGRPDFALSAGLRFEAIRGAVRATGSVAELERGTCEGEVELSQLDCWKQTARNVRGRFRLADGVLSFGLRGAPVVGDLYGGKLKLIAEFALQTGQYRGWVGLEEARLQRAMEELGELKEERSNIAPRPYTGMLEAELAFSGGGRGLGGAPIPLYGSGAVQISGTNLLLVPGFDWLRIMVDAFRRRNTRPLAFETMQIELGLKPDRLVLKEVRLAAPSGFTLYGADAEVLFPSGQLRNLTLRPLDTEIDVLQRVLENAPFTGFNIQGKLWDPTPVPIPLASAFERLLRLIIPGGDEPEPEVDRDDGEE
jgi:hypothetical protein